MTKPCDNSQTNCHIRACLYPQITSHSVILVWNTKCAEEDHIKNKWGKIIFIPLFYRIFFKKTKTWNLFKHLWKKWQWLHLALHIWNHLPSNTVEPWGYSHCQMSNQLINNALFFRFLFSDLLTVRIYLITFSQFS